MQVDTGKIERFAENDTIPGTFTKIPKKHEAEANAILGDKASAFADMKDNKSPLVGWARGVKRNQDAKAKTKMQKASRKKNRK